MDLSLVMFKSDGKRRDFPVTKERVVIGRKPTCDLRIPLSSVSRQHCEIEVDGNIALVRDLGSSNGTFHNSVRIQEQELAAGDALVVGPVTFTVVIDGEPAEIEPVHSYLDDRGDASGPGQATQERAAQSDEPQGLGKGSAELVAQSDADAEDLPDAELDDPLAALERMGSAEDQDDDIGYDLANDDADSKQQQSSSNDDDDEDDGLELLGEEDEAEEQNRKKRGKK